MCLVRLLIRRGDHILCLPRDDDGRLDLPTRLVEEGDRDGAIAIRALADEIVGPEHTPNFLGAVRNIVDSTRQHYPWPTPLAHFGVWQVSGSPIVTGMWIDVTLNDCILSDRHWFALITP